MLNLNKVIGTVINRKWTERISFPHRDFLDLTIAYRYPIIHRSGEIEYKLITDDVIEIWGITEDMLYRAANSNYCGNIITVTAMLHILGQDIEPSPFDSMLYILSNPHVKFGAFGITQMDVLAEHAKWMNSDLGIIPSSVHEVIIFPFSNGIASCIKEFIPIVNRADVPIIDTLSDNLYVYRQATNSVEIYKGK